MLFLSSCFSLLALEFRNPLLRFAPAFYFGCCCLTPRALPFLQCSLRRYALVCRHCYTHNGLVRLEDVGLRKPGLRCCSLVCHLHLSFSVCL